IVFSAVPMNKLCRRGIYIHPANWILFQRGRRNLFAHAVKAEDCNAITWRLLQSPPMPFDCRCTILVSPGISCRRLTSSYRGFLMTYLEAVFRYGATPGENELRAIVSMREVYGVRSVRFNESESTVRVEFDASRLKQDGIAKLLRQAGIDVREPVALT